MQTIDIYGSSDDCIIIEGDFPSAARLMEIDGCDGWRYLHLDDPFPDGGVTVIKCGYDIASAHPDKGWSIEVVRQGTAAVEVLDPFYEEGLHRTDRMRVTGEFSRVECWGSADGPTEADMENFWECFAMDEYELGALIAAHRALQEWGV